MSRLWGEGLVTENKEGCVGKAPAMGLGADDLDENLCFSISQTKA